VFRIGTDGEQGLGGGFEQEIIDDGLVLIGDIANLGGHGEHDMEVGDGQEFGFALGEPLLSERPGVYKELCNWLS
jgi:hypothetical protein